MRAKQITREQLALETERFLKEAARGPVVVRSGKGPVLVIRALDEDELEEALLLRNRRFKSSIRRARKNRAAGKGVPLGTISR